MARKILLADDSVTAQNMGRKILADAGYEVIAVNNGSAALKKIAELKPDLAILDVYMPGYSGLEVCQRLKESPDTARIPVLLSVGKLEPFKPEEAQRVRAEGYIVKPFEASELLSALAKLEDKIVPRAEPSKPGRFARAVAAAEETGRGHQAEAPSEQGAWKSRIGFPHEKTGPEEKVADEASIYNPMNRDLRTVVETPAEKLAEKEDKRRQAAGETSMDVAALASAGLPKDVTPEEIAAIAAAAAQIQMASAVIPGTIEDQHLSETGVSKTASPATLDRTQDEEAQSEPVTMAATAESVMAPNSGASRWTAVSVALESDEAVISLDREMQKAYGAYNAAEPDSTSAATVQERQPAPGGSSSALAEAAELPVVAISNSEREPAPQPEPAISAEVTQVSPDSAAPSDAELASSSVAADFVTPEPASIPEPLSASNPQPAAEVPEPMTPEVAPVEATADASATAVAEPYQEQVPEFVNPVAAESAEPAEPATREWQPAPDAEPAMAEAAAASSGSFAPILHDAEHTEEPKLDPEAVKSTAAAWASWRQIRDTSKGSEAVPVVPVEPHQEEAEVSESAPPDTTAMAVAAGAEQILQAASAAPPNGHSADVASIVERVLADLRPKLMEEISRKMAEKK